MCLANDSYAGYFIFGHFPCPQLQSSDFFASVLKLFPSQWRIGNDDNDDDNNLLAEINGSEE